MESTTILKTTRNARRLLVNQELVFEQLPELELAQHERLISPLHPDDKTISSGVAPSATLAEPDFAGLEESTIASVRQADVEMDDSPVIAADPKEPRTPKKVVSGVLGQEFAEAMHSPC
jgi:hypothetical protein